MSPRIRVEYATLEQAASAFARHGEETRALSDSLGRQAEELLACGWEGEAASAFGREMADLVLPGLRRLAEALFTAQETLKRISQTYADAEKQAAGVFKDGQSLGGLEPAGGEIKPKYKIFLINGIMWKGDAESMKTLEDLKANLEAQYGKDNVEVVIPDYHPYGYYKPMGNFLKDGLGLFGSVVGGVAMVAFENWMGKGGIETSLLYNDIKADLNNLKDGQQVLLIGHSGGGALVSNLYDKLAHEGIPVAGFATLGSPVSNFDLVSDHAGTVLEVTRQNDLIGGSYFRSNEIKTSLLPALSSVPGRLLTDPVGIAVEAGKLLYTDSQARDNFNVARASLPGDQFPIWDLWQQHVNYFDKDTVDLIKKTFPL